MAEDRKPRSLFFPLLLVAAGVLLFLVNIGTIEGTAWDSITLYWPVILIVGGLDGLYRRDGWVGPLVFLGLGTVLLLGNLNIFPASAWALLIRLWPVILIAIGLDVAFGRSRTVLNTTLRIGLGLLLVAGIIWIALTSPFGMGIKETPVKQPLDGATEAQISIALPVGKFDLTGEAESDLLLSGSTNLPKSLDLVQNYHAPTNGRSLMDLSTRGTTTVPLGTSSLEWDFAVNSDIPLDLQTSIAVGEMNVDLSKVQLQKLKLEEAVGEVSVVLPCNQDGSAQINLAVGTLAIYVPKGCNVNIHLDTGLVHTNLPNGYLRVNDSITNQKAKAGSPTFDIQIEVAVGEVRIQELE
ncbi:MAG: hypothetical protein KBF64_00225 [Anaerolineaceae bacterium]|nr:hypothetical protein [Anaerolineaceae bacterium]